MKYRSNVDYTTRDYEGFRNDMIELLKKKIPEYSDFSESDMGIVLIELLAHGLDVISFYNDKVANEIFPDTATERESIIKHCRRLGYELKNATPSQYYQVFKIVPQESTYVIPRGTRLYTKGDDSVEFELIEDLKIPPNCTGLEKDEHGNYLYKAKVEHGSSVESDTLGSSNGTAYQDFTLSYAPVIVDSIHIYVRNEHSIEEWERVDNFIDSDTTSKQFMVEVNESDYVKIMFGSGISGMIPPVYENGIFASYRIGGGIEGNVPLESITEMYSRPAVIIDTMNVEQISVGKDKETIEEAKIHAPLSLRTLWRAVSLDDYENLLYQEFLTEIIKCKAVAEDDRFTISMYVLTNSEKGDLPEDLKTKYLEFLDERKEIGYSIQMYPPLYSDIQITANISTSKAYRNDEIKSITTEFIQSLFKIGNYDFGEPVLKSQIIKQVMTLPGVFDIDIEYTGNIEPSEKEILRVTDVTVNVTGGI